MRIAIVSDIHANLTAFEAVLADLRETAPDLIFHGGDLAHGGASPAEIVDRVRDLGWPGVVGNTDEMLFRPASLDEFASQSPGLRPMWDAIGVMARWDCEALGEARIAWLSTLPLTQKIGSVALVHAAPEDPWRAPAPEASDAEFEAVYAALNAQITVYGHIHRPFIRDFPRMRAANSGSVSLSYNGDPRAAYLLLDGSKPSTRRVAYDIEKELKVLAGSHMPHREWVAQMLQSARPQPLE